MRKLSAVALAMILAISFYFTLFWGFDALRMLTSPTYGLEDVWRSQFVFEIGRIFGLAPMGLIKLAVAIVSAVHILDRFRSLIGGKPNSEILEGGLILVLLISVAAAGPAVWLHNVDLLREQIFQLLLAGVAIALCMAERSYSRSTPTDEPVAVTPQGATWFQLWR